MKKPPDGPAAFPGRASTGGGSDRELSRNPVRNQANSRAERRRAARGAKSGKARIAWEPEVYAVVDRRHRSIDELVEDPNVVVLAVAAGGAPTLLADPNIQELFSAGRPLIFLFERRADHAFIAAVRDAAFAVAPVMGRA
jgi:hypothetical protein